jgi:hypothetical protein
MNVVASYILQAAQGRLFQRKGYGLCFADGGVWIRFCRDAHLVPALFSRRLGQRRRSTAFVTLAGRVATKRETRAFTLAGWTRGWWWLILLAGLRKRR